MSQDNNLDLNRLQNTDLKPAVQVWLESPGGEQQYFFDNSITCTAIIQEKIVVYCYPELITNLSGMAKNYINKNYEEFVYPEDIKKVDQFLYFIYQNNSPKDLLRFRICDWEGNPAWVEITGQPIIYHGKPSALIVATSITNNMRKIQFLKDLTEIYRNFAEQSPDGIVVRQGNRILYANSRAAERSGFSREEIRQVDAFAGVAEDDVNTAREIAAKWDTGQATPSLVELRMVDADGEVFTCEVASSFINYHGEPAVQHTLRDISYRKKIQKELQLQANLLSNVNDCIVVTDSDYQIIFWNQGAERLLGRKEDEVIGQKLGTVLNEDSFVDQIKNDLLMNGHWEGQREIKMTPEGCKTLQLSVTTINDDCDNTSLVLIARDITELLESQRREREANQAKSEFLARLSHEMRTPLVGIVGYCELLRSVSEGPPNQEGLATMEYCARQLLDLANNMLDLSKIEARQVEIKLESVDLYNLINYTVNSFYPNISANVELSVHISSSVPRNVIGDNAKIKQIIANLLSNAFKFTRRGYVKVKVDLANSFKVSEGMYPIRIAIIDTGIGIKETDRIKIFEPFVHDVIAADGEDGTGLGLAICRQLVELMGGSIWCKANPEGGSEFGFVLPLKASAAPPAPVESGQAITNMHVPDGLEVLLAEDISVNRKLITLMLEKLGCEVVAVSNGEQCVNMLDEYKPDIILMDMQMPVMDGYSATRIIKGRSSLAAIPVIALTAYAMTEDVDKCQEAGCDYYLSKPFTNEQLASALKQCSNV